MSLRITQSMLFARALNDIRKSSRGIIRVQEHVASGRRINRPSDDPAAILRLLSINAELLDFKHLLDNTHLAKGILDTGASALEEGSTAMSRLKELLVQAANGTVSPGDRKIIGFEVEQLLNHMVGIANSKRGNSYLFGGTRTETPPFRLVSDGGGTRVVYDGSLVNHEIDVAPGIRTSLYSAGDRFFQSIDRGLTIIKGITGAQATSSRDTGRGFASLDVTFGALNAGSLPTGVSAGASISSSTAVGVLSYTYTAGAPPTMSIDGGPALPVPVTNGAFQTGSDPQETIYLDISGAVSPASGTMTAEADLSIDGKTKTRVDFTNNQVVVTDSFDGSVLNVDVSSLVRTGKDEVTYTGTFDVFTVMITAKEILENAANLTNTEVQIKLQTLIGEATNAHDMVLNGLQELGIRSSNLELLRSRMDGLILSDESIRSNIQDSDLAESISEMMQKQFNFQASLQVSARIIQTSLLNFLR